LKAADLSSEHVDEITTVGSTQHARYFPSVISPYKKKPSAKAVSKEFSLHAGLLLVAMFLLLAPLAMASPSYEWLPALGKRADQPYTDPHANGGNMITVSATGQIDRVGLWS
jgi:hypothetical protein